MRRTGAAVLCAAMLIAGSPAAGHPGWPEYRRRHVELRHTPLLLREGTLSEPLMKWLQERRRQVRAARAEWERIDRRWRAARSPVAGWGPWLATAQCESSLQPKPVPGYYEGWLQFDPATWDAHAPAGYPESAEDATVAQEVTVAWAVLESHASDPWPNCPDP